MKILSKLKHLWLIVPLLGVFIRLYQLNEIPSGFNNDEASAAFEAYSLWQTGHDRWGNFLPVYFPSWGSGQNVLYSYLAAPIVGWLGNEIWSFRLVSAVFGILTIGLAYFLTKTFFQAEFPARLAAILYALNPWHVLASRWGLEENITPFFVLLGLLTLARSFRNPTKLNIILSLAPLSFLWYAYATNIFVLPIFLILVLLYFWPTIRQHKLDFALSFLIFTCLSLPFSLFILKNNILKHDLGLENFLPFTIPLLASERVQLNWEAITYALPRNLRFVSSGFSYDWPWNNTQNTPSHGLITLFFGLLASIYIIYEICVFTYSKSLSLLRFLPTKSIGKISLPNPDWLLGLWLLACLPMFIFIEQNLNRSSMFQAILPILGAYGVWLIYKPLSKTTTTSLPTLQPVFLATIIAVTLIQAAWFTYDYFFLYPPTARQAFNYGYQEALNAASQEAKLNSEKILVTGSLGFNYVHTAYFANFSPAEFQHSNWHKSGQGYEVSDFGSFYMDSTANRNKLNQQENSFLYIFKANESSPCTQNVELISSNAYWQIGRCKKSYSYSTTKQQI